MLIVLLFVAAVATQAAPKVIVVDVDSVIDPITVQIVGHAIDEATRENAAAVLLRLNTPGGLLDATRGITSRIVASPVPVIAYVTPSGGRAASAGFFLLESADVAAMALGTNTGASSPVLIFGQMDPVERSKVENDAAARRARRPQRKGLYDESRIRMVGRNEWMDGRGRDVALDGDRRAGSNPAVHPD